MARASLPLTRRKLSQVVTLQWTRSSSSRHFWPSFSCWKRSRSCKPNRVAWEDSCLSFTRLLLSTSCDGCASRPPTFSSCLCTGKSCPPALPPSLPRSPPSFPHDKSCTHYLSPSFPLSLPPSLAGKWWRSPRRVPFGHKRFRPTMTSAKR